MNPFAARCQLATVVLAVSLGCAGCATLGGTQMTTEVVNRPMPPLVVNALASGTPIDVARRKGKVVLVDIWASWCPPCKDELPALDDLARRLAGRGVEVIAVSIDEERAQAEAFLSVRERWTLTLAHDPQGKVPELLAPPKMPSSYVIDSAGRLRYINAGYEPGGERRIEQQLLELAGRR